MMRISSFKRVPLWIKLLVIIPPVLFFIVSFANSYHIWEHWMTIAPMPRPTEALETLGEFEDSIFCRDSMCTKVNERVTEDNTVAYSYDTKLSPSMKVEIEATTCELRHVIVTFHDDKPMNENNRRSGGIAQMMNTMFTPGFNKPRRMLIRNLLAELNPQGDAEARVEEMREDFTLVPNQDGLIPIGKSNPSPWGDYQYSMLINGFTSDKTYHRSLVFEKKNPPKACKS